MVACWDTMSPVEQQLEGLRSRDDVQRKVNADAEAKSVEMMKSAAWL
jgi:hypothetical protein